MEEDIKKLAELIKDIDMCMLVTVSEDGLIHARPMSTQTIEFDGELWFFTFDNTEKVTDIKKNPNVNVSYSDKGKNRFISVSGIAELTKDKTKIDELWSPVLKAWFPEGKDDPSLTLIKIKVYKAEYWDSPENTVVRLVNFVKALATGTEDQSGENKKINLTDTK